MRALLIFVLAGAGFAQTVPLDGEWDTEDSLDANAVPRNWTHRVKVPGLANLARPAFADVDRYITKEFHYDLRAFGLQPGMTGMPALGPHQNRNYFWYRRSFRAPAKKQVAVVRINKAQFGTAVWLNGKKLGEYPGCFSASEFDATAVIHWTGDNELIVRIGAHPGVLPPDYPSGVDFEKSKWTPGIYDSVSLHLADNPVIETVQVAPRIRESAIVVQTKLRNYGSAPVSARLTHRIEPGGSSRAQAAAIPAGQTVTLTETIAVPGARLWSPEDPFLYTLETATAGDRRKTRFGMREFRFDTPTRRAFLNGKPFFMRGSNITFHRFLEDPDTRDLPWTESWVRRLLVDIPKQMNWNSFRFCIGPVPDRWLEIADETGLLIQNEFFHWTGGRTWMGPDQRRYNTQEMIRQYSDWVRDNWNHASVVIWDANNETEDDSFHRDIIPAVRKLDLSNRPWENSYNPPAGPDDPVEDHPYFFSRGTMGDKNKVFDIAELERITAHPRPTFTPTAHALIANEYGWLWLLRDGTPTPVSKRVYDQYLPNATPRERLEWNAYMVAAETEFFRAHRQYAGVLHFVYLTFCYPGAFTCDHFEDIPSLKLHPEFSDYVREAFKPLGLYINFFQPKLAAGRERRFTVMMVNDEYRPASGKLVLSLERAGGEAVARAEQSFAIPALGAETYLFDVRVPDARGEFLLKAAAYATGKKEPTLSRRKVAIE